MSIAPKHPVTRTMATQRQRSMATWCHGSVSVTLQLPQGHEKRRFPQRECGLQAFLSVDSGAPKEMGIPERHELGLVGNQLLMNERMAALMEKYDKIL